MQVVQLQCNEFAGRPSCSLSSQMIDDKVILVNLSKNSCLQYINKYRQRVFIVIIIQKLVTSLHLPSLSTSRDTENDCQVLPPPGFSNTSYNTEQVYVIRQETTEELLARQLTTRARNYSLHGIKSNLGVVKFWFNSFQMDTRDIQGCISV